MKKTPRGIGLNLAFKLYLLLLILVGPTFLIYYIYYFRTIEVLHDQEVTDLAQLLTYRVEDRLVAALDRERTAISEEDRVRGFEEDRRGLQRELERIVHRYPGVEALAVFRMREENELEGVAFHGPSAPERATTQDMDAAGQGRIVERDIQSGTAKLRTISVPIGKLQGILHLRVVPDRIGLGNRLPALRTNLALGGAAMLLIVGIGVAVFFHIAVRRPIAELSSSMEEIASGNLTVHAPSRTGEFGWLGASYNRMIRRLKASMDENRQLLEQIRRFNDELQEKIRGATEELASKNVQLQEVNERLFTTQRQMTTMEKLATLGQVATIIAHELGTPLNAISGHLQLLLDADASDPKNVERLKIIDGQVDRLTGIVRNVLRSLRVPPPKPEPLRMDEVIRRETELIEPVARKRGVSVELKIPSDLPVVRADPDQMEQVLLNLFSNALDAMSGGGRLGVAARPASKEEVAQVAPRVWVPAEEADHVRIDVSDTGRGMPAAAIKKAFEPYFTTKAEEKNGDSSLGVGMGLAICREIVRNHQGEIVINSEPGKGSTFTFYLPVYNGKDLSHN